MKSYKVYTPWGLLRTVYPDGSIKSNPIKVENKEPDSEVSQPNIEDLSTADVSSLFDILFGNFEKDKKEIDNYDDEKVDVVTDACDDKTTSPENKRLMESIAFYETQLDELQKRLDCVEKQIISTEEEICDLQYDLAKFKSSKEIYKSKISAFTQVVKTLSSFEQ